MSCRQFVLSQEEEIATLRQEVSKGIWDLIAWPIGIILAVILAGLIYTQEELPSILSAFVGGASVLLPAISKIWELFKSEKSSVPNT